MTPRSRKYFKAKKRKPLLVGEKSPALSNLVVNADGEVLRSYSHVKVHDAGVITYVMKFNPYDGIPDEIAKNAPEGIYDAGWGNGYISIPAGHPFLEKVENEIRTTNLFGLVRSYNITYEQLNRDYAPDNNCWTYSEFGKIDGFEGDYMTFGFDSCHAWQNKKNWPESRVVETVENFVKIVNSQF